MKIKKTTIVETKHVEEMDLNPADFTDKQTISSLEHAVERRFRQWDPHDQRVISKKTEIPKDFIDGWKKLVDFIPDNVMSYSYRDELLKRNDVYVETYTGNYLNSRRYVNTWHSFDLYNYCEFMFKSDAEYKCWLTTRDNWDHTSTTLLYAEEIKGNGN